MKRYFGEYRVQFEHIFLPFVTCVALYSLKCIIPKILDGYSYWHDELWSVTTAQLNGADLWETLHKETNPPLYTLILKFWIYIFGVSEPATRSLSLIFGVLAILLFIKLSFSISTITSYVGAAYLVANPLFFVYTNETRSYSLLLLSSVISTLLFVRHLLKLSSTLSLSVACLFMSLLHYFGLFYALVLLFTSFITTRTRKSMIVICATFIIILIPFSIDYFVNLRRYTGGNFWIKVDGIEGTTKIILAAVLPLPSGNGIRIFIACVLFVAIAALSFFYMLKRPFAHSNVGLAKAVIALLFCILCFIIPIGAIDFYTPISVERYYIVLLPPVSLLIGLSLNLSLDVNFKLGVASTAAVLVFISAMNYSSNKLLSERPWENWKDASKYVVENAADRNLYFVGSSVERKRIANFYVKWLSHDVVELKPFLENVTVRKSLILVPGEGYDRYRGSLRNLDGFVSKQFAPKSAWGFPRVLVAD